MTSETSDGRKRCQALCCSTYASSCLSDIKELVWIIRGRVALVCFAIVVAASLHADLGLLDGRNYYRMSDPINTCRANSLGRPTIMTWSDHIEFSGSQVLIWGEICNDNPELRSLNDFDIVVSGDLTTVHFGGVKYTYSPKPPSLCESGSWCEVGNINQEDQP